MSEIGIIILILGLLVMWDFVQWGPGSNVYPSTSNTKSTHRYGSGW